jgi:RNase P/RNase MRP subunit p29
MIPKKYTKFRFTTPANEKIEVNGSVLLYRPEDRVKKGERYGKGKN